MRLLSRRFIFLRVMIVGFWRRVESYKVSPMSYLNSSTFFFSVLTSTVYNLDFASLHERSISFLSSFFAAKQEDTDEGATWSGSLRPSGIRPTRPTYGRKLSMSCFHPCLLGQKKKTLHASDYKLNSWMTTLKLEIFVRFVWDLTSKWKML
jgi:hypothetical protein